MDNQSLARENVMSMSRKNYEELASVIRVNAMFINSDAERVQLIRVMKDMAIVFKGENSRFDRVRFFRACGLESFTDVSAL